MDGLTASRQIAERARAASRRPTPVVVRAHCSVRALGTAARTAHLTASAPRSSTHAQQALTGACSDEEKKRCTEAGMCGHVSKPVRLDVLQALLLKYGGGEV
jgi:CheY-like chemotaxis protein